MNRTDFNAFCETFPSAANVVQWGDASVWKVGGPKGPVFAIHSNWGAKGGVVLKPSEMAREIWRGAPGVSLAPYLGRAGWIMIEPDAMTADELKALIAGSHEINAAKLTKRARAAAGLD